MNTIGFRLLHKIVENEKQLVSILYWRKSMNWNELNMN